MRTVVYPIRILAKLGIKHLIGTLFTVSSTTLLIYVQLPTPPEALILN
jgi:hypothetical protein